MIESLAALLHRSLDQNFSAMALLVLFVGALYLFALPSREK